MSWTRNAMKLAFALLLIPMSRNVNGIKCIANILQWFTRWSNFFSEIRLISELSKNIQSIWWSVHTSWIICAVLVQNATTSTSMLSECPFLMLFALSVLIKLSLSSKGWHWKQMQKLRWWENNGHYLAMDRSETSRVFKISLKINHLRRPDFYVGLIHKCKMSLKFQCYFELRLLTGYEAKATGNVQAVVCWGNNPMFWANFHYFFAFSDTSVHTTGYWCEKQDDNVNESIRRRCDNCYQFVQ